MTAAVIVACAAIILLAVAYALLRKP